MWDITLDKFFCLQGQRCARHPWRVLGFAVLAVLICSMGMLRFRVETDPQRLWVGPTSLAATEKAAYEVCSAADPAKEGRNYVSHACQHCKASILKFHATCRSLLGHSTG